MRFPRFWTRAYNAKKTVSARGWSESSLAEPTQNAESRLARVLAALSSPADIDLDRYDYVVDNVICEEVVDRIIHDDVEVTVISRNAYGSLIMNAANMMFVDIDFPPPTVLLGGCLFSLFSKPKPKPVQATPEQQILERVREWQSTHPETTLRAYRTAAGIRLIAINISFDVVDNRAVSIMESLGSDSLYIQLCRSQNCFRARLTPKPWRIGMPKPPVMFPFDSPDDKARFDDWYAGYVENAKKYKVCTHIETFGHGSIHPNHVAPIEIHDRLCCDDKDLPLA